MLASVVAIVVNALQPDRRLPIWMRSTHRFSLRSGSRNLDDSDVWGRRTSVPNDNVRTFGSSVGLTFDETRAVPLLTWNARSLVSTPFGDTDQFCTMDSCLAEYVKRCPRLIGQSRRANNLHEKILPPAATAQANIEFIC